VQAAANGHLPVRKCRNGRGGNRVIRGRRTTQILPICSFRRERPVGNVVNPQLGEYSEGSGTRLFRAPCPNARGACNDTSHVPSNNVPCGISWSALRMTMKMQRSHDPICEGSRAFGCRGCGGDRLYGMPVYPDVSREWNRERAGDCCASATPAEKRRARPLLTSQHETWVVRSPSQRRLQPTNCRLPHTLTARSEDMKRISQTPTLPQLIVQSRDLKRRPANQTSHVSL